MQGTWGFHHHGTQFVIYLANRGCGIIDIIKLTSVIALITYISVKAP